MSKPFSLNLVDFGKGLLVAVSTAVIVKLAAVMQVPGFDFAQFDWTSLIAIAVSSGLAYLAKNFTQDANGEMFGSAKYRA